MKAVVHYISGPYLPITGTWIYGQIENLTRYKPIVYCHTTQNLDTYPTKHIRSLELKEGIGDPSTFFNKAWKKLFKFYPPFSIFLLRDRPELFHAHFGSSGYDLLRLKRIFKLPLVTTFYGFDLSLLPSQYPEWRTRYKRLFQGGEISLVEGNHMKQCLVELGCPPEKIIVQYLGIDLNHIEFDARKLGEDKEIRILISAHFREKKGIPYAVEAFGRVKQIHPELMLKLTIIGDSAGSPGQEEEKRKIFGVIQEYNLENHVNLLGYRVYPAFLKELYRHHIFIHPSIHASNGDIEGGAPVCIIEASASGMPILSTTHCDIPEVVIDKESGYLVPERDVDSLAERLDFLLSNPILWEKMGLKGREHIEKNYDVVKQGQRLEEIYDRALT